MDFISTHIYPTDPLGFEGADMEEQIEAASRLVKEPLGFAYADRTIRFDVDFPSHAVAAVTLELAPEPSDAGGAACAASHR